jgi:hypothetical protein
MVVEQNNPPGNAAETDNDTVIFYYALTGLPALEDFVETDDDDATYSVYPGPLADAGNVDTVSTLTGLPAFGVDIPSASAASLGLPAGRSNSSRNDDVSGVGPDGVDGNVGGPADDCALGDGTIGLAADSGIHPPASPGNLNGSVDGSDAPPGILVDVGPAADAQGPTEVVGATDAGLIGTDTPSMQQSAQLYPLFYRGNEDRGQRIASAVKRTRTAPRVSSSPAALAALPVDAKQASRGVEGVPVQTLDTSRVGGITEGVPVRTLGPLPPRTVVETVETAAALVAEPGPAVCLDGCAGGTCVNGRARTFVPATVLAATARAIANPYANSARGTVADTGGGVGGAVGDVVVAPGDAPPATAGTAAAGNAPPVGGNVQGVHGHFVPHTFMEEELHGGDP